MRLDRQSVSAIPMEALFAAVICTGAGVVTLLRLRRTGKEVPLSPMESETGSSKEEAVVSYSAPKPSSNEYGNDISKTIISNYHHSRNRELYKFRAGNLVLMGAEHASLRVDQDSALDYIREEYFLALASSSLTSHRHVRAARVDLSKILGPEYTLDLGLVTVEIQGEKAKIKLADASKVTIDHGAMRDEAKRLEMSEMIKKGVGRRAVN